MKDEDFTGRFGFVPIATYSITVHRTKESVKVPKRGNLESDAPYYMDGL